MTAPNPLIAGRAWASTVTRSWNLYWYEAMPVARVDIFAAFVYAAVIYTVLRMDGWVVGHAYTAQSFYQPVLIARVLHVPAPSSVSMTLLQVSIVASAALALTRRWPRASGVIVFLGYGTWLLWAFSYGKVDHDRLTIMVALLALAVTPRVGAGVEATNGWSLRLVQVAFALAYPLSAIAKLRASGIDWMNSATFARAIIRRGTWIGDLWLEPSWLLVIAQWAFVGFELFAVVLLLPRGRLRSIALVGAILLHLFTFAAIGIHFLPHTICIAAFFPLERLTRRDRRDPSAPSLQPEGG